ncbi:hypothetical protein GCM10015535_34920 [Streptomyces gelaticus]|uniref:Acyl-CoA carboxylase subunit epsilon n=1 Tax=Streptomyces gelaticus TaxID=285446 RepID=A0ABQ2VZG3_9ACTN|nr:hypothetical protein GCM10015535_34920 [Streptomyces gelaticus]
MTGTISPGGPELVTGADELAALLVETVNGGSSVGFLASSRRWTVKRPPPGAGRGPGGRGRADLLGEAQ